MDERELYAGPFEDFVTRRRALAAQLRAEGEPVAAKAVLARRKPTRSAWLVNILTLAAPEGVEEFLALGPELVRAHHEADGAQLRELSRARARLVDRLATQAVAAGRARGYTATPAVRDEAAETLTAALADPDLARSVRAGTLVQAERASGFGPAGSLSPLAPVIPLHPERVERATQEPARVEGPAWADRAAAMAEQLSAAESALAEAGAAAVAGRERADRAAMRLRGARERAHEKECEVDDLRALLETAERRLADARGAERAAEHEASEAAAVARETDAARARAEAGLERARAEAGRELGLSSGPSS